MPFPPAIVRFTVTLHRPGDGKSATLPIREPTACVHEFQDLAPGAYTIQMVYANREAKLGTMVRGIKDQHGLSQDTPLWVGGATMKEVTVEIADKSAAGVSQVGAHDGLAAGILAPSLSPPSDTLETSREGVFSGLVYYRVGDEFLVGLGDSTPLGAECISFLLKDESGFDRSWGFSSRASAAIP